VTPDLRTYLAVKAAGTAPGESNARGPDETP
jgi:hypothetical protein